MKGEDAIKKVRDEFYNLALLDIKLPDIRGVDLIKLLKEIQPNTEVLMMTAYASQETAIEALNMGASAYIIKPFNMQEVILKINNIFERQRLAEEKERAEEIQDN